MTRLDHSHAFSVGDKIWVGEHFGQVVDITHRRVRVLLVDKTGVTYRKWIDPSQLRRR